MNYQVHTSTMITIEEAGLHRIEVCEDATIEVQIKAKADVLFTYTGVERKSQVKIMVDTTLPVSILHWNDCSNNLQLEVAYQLGNDASVVSGVAELSNANATYTIHADLDHAGSELRFHSATIAQGQVDYAITMKHIAPHTTCYMENYALVKKGANLRIVDEGAIKAGAFASASHQTTRVLTLDQDQVSEVVPLLLIDENDVKASHATSVGQPDENQLYYLQTRGLSRVQALGLMSIGYVLPITEIIKEEALQEELKNIVSYKVENL